MLEENMTRIHSPFSIALFLLIAETCPSATAQYRPGSGFSVGAGISIPGFSKYYQLGYGIGVGLDVALGDGPVSLSICAREHVFEPQKGRDLATANLLLLGGGLSISTRDRADETSFYFTFGLVTVVTGVHNLRGDVEG